MQAAQRLDLRRGPGRDRDTEADAVAGYLDESGVGEIVGQRAFDVFVIELEGSGQGKYGLLACTPTWVGSFVSVLPAEREATGKREHRGTRQGVDFKAAVWLGLVALAPAECSLSAEVNDRAT